MDGGSGRAGGRGRARAPPLFFQVCSDCLPGKFCRIDKDGGGHGGRTQTRGACGESLIALPAGDQGQSQSPRHEPSANPTA